MERVRDLSELPKAHLHLHFTGSMRPTTVLELADKYGVRLPEALTEALTSGEPPRLRATDERGWFRFQRLYDAARSCVRGPEDIQRLVREAAEEDVRDGSGWLEIQVDPTSYAPRLGGLIPALEVILDAVDTTARETGLGMRVLVAANRMKHPLDARTLARLAVRANVAASVDHLRHGSEILERLIRTDGLRVIGAEYAIETGVVEFLEES